MVLTIDAGDQLKAVEPEYIRLPRPGQRDPYFGLSRSYLNELILPCKANSYRPSVKSAVLRKKGARTGVRLIHLQSLREFIKKHELVFSEPTGLH
jgi:hypothetical protein